METLLARSPLHLPSRAPPPPPLPLVSRAPLPSRLLAHVRIPATAAASSSTSPPSTISPVEQSSPSSLSPQSLAQLKKVSSDSLQYDSGFLGGISEKTPPLDGGDGDGRDGVPNAFSYLTSILSSRVYDVAIESPLQLATKLSERLGVNLWLKREDLQPVKTFDSGDFFGQRFNLFFPNLEFTS